jgi:hypothetical protein
MMRRLFIESLTRPQLFQLFFAELQVDALQGCEVIGFQASRASAEQVVIQSASVTRVRLNEHISSSYLLTVQYFRHENAVKQNVIGLTAS